MTTTSSDAMREAHETLDMPPAPEGIARLDDWGVIRASGEDAGTFLQGQLTNDVLGLAAGEARLAGYCSAKGRLLASFVVWRGEAQDYLLACSADLLGAVLKRLSMFVLRAKCKLTDASAEVPLAGLAGSAAVNTLAASGLAWPQRSWARVGSVIRLPDALVGAERCPRALLVAAAPPALGLAPMAAPSWRWLEALAATPRIVAATGEQFVPQMVNLELVGGVNFQKGCYPGQEIVARSQYRGTLKRRGFVVASEAPLAPGQELFHDADAGQPAGMVVNAGSHAGHHAGLVELKLLAIGAAGELHAGSADGPRLHLLALPYELPAAEAA